MSGDSSISPSDRLRVKVVTGTLETLLPEWEELFGRDSRAMPFSSAGWARAWVQHYPDMGEPWVLTVRDAWGTLLGIAPFALTRRGPARVLGAFGSDPADYWDIVADDNHRESVVEAAIAGLLANAGSWDLLNLTCLPAWSDTHTAFERHRDLRAYTRPWIPCPAVRLPATFDEWLARLSSNRRSNFRRAIKKVDNGTVTIREVTDPAELPGAVARWQQLRKDQWDGRGMTIARTHIVPRFRDFTTALVRDLVPAGLAVVWEVLADDQQAGIYINYQDSTTFYRELGGFDLEFTNLGIGKITDVYGIRQSIEAGRTWFDFTVGSEDYKYSYGAEERYVPRSIFAHRGARSQVALHAAIAADHRRGREDQL
ncbi:MAG: GNAT family N-acetyltransferase [Solirubrobacterales bacterium]